MFFFVIAKRGYIKTIKKENRGQHIYTNVTASIMDGMFEM